MGSGWLLIWCYKRIDVCELLRLKSSLTGIYSRIDLNIVASSWLKASGWWTVFIDNTMSISAHVVGWITESHGKFWESCGCASACLSRSIIFPVRCGYCLSTTSVATNSSCGKVQPWISGYYRIDPPIFHMPPKRSFDQALFIQILRIYRAMLLKNSFLSVLLKIFILCCQSLSIKVIHSIILNIIFWLYLI